VARGVKLARNGADDLEQFSMSAQLILSWMIRVTLYLGKCWGRIGSDCVSVGDIGDRLFGTR
jgi:hypothetical protein